MNKSNPIPRIIKQLKIGSDIRVYNLLMGNYLSAFKGRGLDLDELREYVIGDNIRDIDWKASARTERVQVKKYIETRENYILFAIDTSSSMNYIDTNYHLKRDSLVGLMYLIGRIALTNGDRVGMIYGNADHITERKFSNRNSDLMRMLYELNTSLLSSSYVGQNWEYFFDSVNRRIKKRTICFVISDDLYFNQAAQRKLKITTVKHELIFVELGNWLGKLDNYDLGGELIDIETSQRFDWFLDNEIFNGQQTEELQKLQLQNTQFLRGLNSRYCYIPNREHLMPELVKLLKSKVHPRRMS